MNNAEQMAKLRAIVTGDANKREKLDEMFFFRDKSPEAQRQANKPKDALQVRANDKKFNDDVKSGKYDGWAVGTRKINNKLHGPKGELPEADGAMDPELSALMAKYGVTEDDNSSTSGMEEGSCNMTAEGERCPMHGLEECGYMEESKKKKPDADGDGVPDWADKKPGEDDNADKPKKKKGMTDKQKKYFSKVKEGVHIDIDGPEAEMFINRIAELAGTSVPMDAGATAGSDCCDKCGEYDCRCDGEDLMPMENADHDYSMHSHNPEGEPVDAPEYIPDQVPQRFVRSQGDNSMMKENASQLFKKLKGDYKKYVAEAELARSNAGEASPLTANNRDEFDKDPFAGETPVTDGTHSPLSTIERQRVSK